MMSDETLRKLIEVIGTVLAALIGAIGAAKVGGRKQGQQGGEQPKKPLPAGAAPGLSRRTFILLTIGGGLLGALLGYLIFPALGRVFVPPRPAITITQPRDGSVSLRVVVRGTRENLPGDQYMWLLVYPHETNSYYPQRQPVNLYENGEWQGQVLIGREGEVGVDVGKRFDIVVALADVDAHRQLEQYMEQGAVNGDYYGLETLPDGLHLYDRVTVVRE